MKGIPFYKKDLFEKSGKLPSTLYIIKRIVSNPGFRVVVYYRLSLFLRKNVRIRLLGRVLSKLILVRLSRVPGVEINSLDEIGVGIHFPHPHDIVIGTGSKIGRNVTIYNGVTLGGKRISSNNGDIDIYSRFPIIEDNVVIYTGAKLIGGITIGENSIIGANSVVMKSFPRDSIIAGSPAKIISKKNA